MGLFLAGIQWVINALRMSDFIKEFTIFTAIRTSDSSYPFSEHITEYAILPVGNEFIIFGGVDYSNCRIILCTKLSTIAGFNPFKNTWRRLGKLKSPRNSHVIRLYDQFIMIGGYRTDKAGNASGSSIESYSLNEIGSNPEFEFSFEKIVP